VEEFAEAVTSNCFVLSYGSFYATHTAMAAFGRQSTFSLNWRRNNREYQKAIIEKRHEIFASCMMCHFKRGAAIKLLYEIEFF